MTNPTNGSAGGHADPVANGGLYSLPRLWGRRGFWRIRLRWAVAPVVAAGVLAGELLGFDLRTGPILLVALANFLYNVVFAWIFRRYAERLDADPRLDQRLLILEVAADYAAMLVLIQLTGGASSPLVLFLLFHVIIGAVQFSTKTAFLFAALAAGGMWDIFVLQALGRLPRGNLGFHGAPLDLFTQPAHAAIYLGFFTATLFLAAGIVSRIMRQLRRRVGDLARATGELVDLNSRLNSLYAMVFAIGAERRLGPTLETVARELARVTGVPATAIKRLSEDGRTLRYVAAYGLPEELTRNVIDLEQSPLNRRVVEGETLVHGRVGGEDTLQFEEELEALGIRSAIFAPLQYEGNVFGTLGVYAHTAGRFSDRDTEFLKLAADLAAIAIEDARANEEIEKLGEERTQFMLKVAHNLRAPLSAGLSLLELVKGGHLGPVLPAQAEHLERIDERLRALDRAIGQLLTIARTRDFRREIPDVVVDLEELARQTEATFHAEAELKGLRLEVSAEAGLPPVDSGVDLLKEMMENLVSNAVRYTPAGGAVRVRFARGEPGEVRIVVADTGIGIPAAEQAKLFQEFFRASNAKRQSPAGTGLGLALVKRTVERHHGRIRLESAEGKGTTVTIDLPVRRIGQPAPPQPVVA